MVGFGVKKEIVIFFKIVYVMCEGLNLNEGDFNWDIF